MDIQDGLSEIKTIQRYNFDVTNFDDEKRTIDFIFTTNTTDRSNDIVNPKGAILDDFKNNPVFLWSHDKTKQPLGRVVEIDIGEDGSLFGKVDTTLFVFKSEYSKKEFVKQTNELINKYDLKSTGYVLTSVKKKYYEQIKYDKNYTLYATKIS